MPFYAGEEVHRRRREILARFTRNCLEDKEQRGKGNLQSSIISWLLFFNLTTLSHLIHLLVVAKHEGLTLAVNLPGLWQT